MKPSIYTTKEQLEDRIEEIEGLLDHYDSLEIVDNFQQMYISKLVKELHVLETNLADRDLLSENVNMNAEMAGV